MTEQMLIYTCFRPLLAIKELHDLYTPIERYSVDGEVKQRAALPGYVFCPAWTVIPKVIFYRFSLKPLVVEDTHKTVAKEDLLSIQRTLNEEFENNRRPERGIVYDFVPGDPVRVYRGHAFEGLLGIFSRYKGNQRGRISTEFGYVDVNLCYLTKEKG